LVIHKCIVGYWDVLWIPVQKHLCVHERKLGYIVKFLSGVCLSGSRAFFSGYAVIVQCFVVCVLLQVTMTVLFPPIMSI
jgi:hypothetical protein